LDTDQKWTTTNLKNQLELEPITSTKTKCLR